MGLWERELEILKEEIIKDFDPVKRDMKYDLP